MSDKDPRLKSPEEIATLHKEAKDFHGSGEWFPLSLFDHIQALTEKLEFEINRNVKLIKKKRAMKRELEIELVQRTIERDDLAQAIVSTDDPIGSCPWCKHPLKAIWAGKSHENHCVMHKAKAHLKENE